MVGTAIPPGPSPLRGPGPTGNEDEEPIEIVGTALNVGYMGLDTDTVYDKEVGREVVEIGIAREQNDGGELLVQQRMEKQNVIQSRENLSKFLE